MTDKQSVKNAELLADSAPQWSMKLAYDLAKLLQSGGKLLEEVTDDVPYDEKTTTTTTTISNSPN